jgi:hypothetical protein
VSIQPQPAPRPSKPRLLHDGRDMFWSIAPLVAACVLLAGLAGTCSIRPVGTDPAMVPSYDAAAALRADAATLGFPVRLPALPDGWRPNSGSRDGIDDGRTDAATHQRLRASSSTVGYLSPTGMYLRLTQSNADETELVGFIHRSMHPTGTVDVDDTAWIVYEGDGKAEPVWTARLAGPAGPTQVAITGAGSADEFRTLAEATQSQPPLA